MEVLARERPLEMGSFKREIKKTGGLGRSFFWKAGASEGIRTLDIHLGKVTLYQTELHSR